MPDSSGFYWIFIETTTPDLWYEGVIYYNKEEATVSYPGGEVPNFANVSIWFSGLLEPPKPPQEQEE